MYVGLDGAMSAAGAVLGNGNSATGMVLCVLYPSGTLFLTRMPTLRSEDCVSAGSGGDSGDVSREGEPVPALVLPLRWKNESIEGWYWRLRLCSAEDAGTAIVFVLAVGDFWNQSLGVLMVRKVG